MLSLVIILYRSKLECLSLPATYTLVQYLGKAKSLNAHRSPTSGYTRTKIKVTDSRKHSSLLQFKLITVVKGFTVKATLDLKSVSYVRI